MTIYKLVEIYFQERSNMSLTLTKNRIFKLKFRFKCKNSKKFIILKLFFKAKS